MQPLEATLIASLVDIVRDCQETISKAYREGSETVGSTKPSTSILTDNPTELSQQYASNSASTEPADQYIRSTGFLESISEAPPPQIWDNLEVRLSEVESRQAVESSPGEPFHDSGYAESFKNSNCKDACSCKSAEVTGEDNLLSATEPVYQSIQ